MFREASKQPTSGRSKAEAAARLRLLRGALAVSAIITAAALVSAAWLSWRAVRDASDTIARGQGELLLTIVAERIRAERPPGDALLETVLDDESERGLTFIAVLGPTGVPISRAGTPEREGDWLDGDGPPDVRRIGDRVRMVRPLDPPPHHAGPPPRGGRRGRGDLPLSPGPPELASPGGPGPPVRPHLVIELEPLESRALVTRASRALLVSLAGAALLIIVALIVWRLVRQRERMLAHLQRDRRLAALGEMSSVLAHEIRNPLAALKGHAQLLVEALPDSERPRAKAERIVGEAVRLERLTNDLLDFVRTGQIERRSASPAELARAVAGRFDASSVRLNLDSAPPQWSLDPERIDQVLANLLVNAREASPDGEPIDLVVGLTRGQLELTVRDRGTGLTSPDSARLFEPFHTTRTQGTGLGLAVVQRIVALHGGTVEGFNHPDGGAVFKVTIPAA